MHVGKFFLGGGGGLGFRASGYGVSGFRRFFREFGISGFRVLGLGFGTQVPSYFWGSLPARSLYKGFY